jgi:hypothetical protein
MGIICSFQLGFAFFFGGLLHYQSSKNLFAHVAHIFGFLMI